MSTIVIKEYGTIISDEELGNRIFDAINKCIDTDGVVTIDMQGVKTMATFCAKQIFGKLCKKLGQSVFFEKVTIVSASERIKTSIRVGILSALSEEEA